MSSLYPRPFPTPRPPKQADSLIYECRIGILCESEPAEARLVPIYSLTHTRMAHNTYFTVLSLIVNFQNGLNLVSICCYQNHLMFPW